MWTDKFNQTKKELWLIDCICPHTLFHKHTLTYTSHVSNLSHYIPFSYMYAFIFRFTSFDPFSFWDKRGQTRKLFVIFGFSAFNLNCVYRDFAYLQFLFIMTMIMMIIVAIILQIAWGANLQLCKCVERLWNVNQSK